MEVIRQKYSSECDSKKKLPKVRDTAEGNGWTRQGTLKENKDVGRRAVLWRETSEENIQTIRNIAVIALLSEK